VEKWCQELTDLRGTKMFKLQSRLRYIKNKIKEWNVIVFGNIFKEKAIIEEKLEQIHKGWTSGNNDQGSTDQEKI